MVKIVITYLLTMCALVGNAQQATQFSVNRIEVPIDGEIYSPVFRDSMLIVCGTRKDRITHTHLDKDGQEPIDLYVLNTDSAFSYERFDEKFRSDFHDGPISFNEKGNRCIVSRNLRLDQRFKSTQQEENHLGLFESRYVYGEWRDLEPLAINSDEYNCTHPALSENGNTLIFASNMPGGQGGYDLWKLEKIQGIWGEPENLGVDVNTSGNEFFPTWVGSQIYFSSNRQEFGGLDVYQVENDGEKVITRILSEPLNSDKDDFGVISKDSGESGYFSSNRSGKDQLWSYGRAYPNFNDCDSLVNDDFCYTLLEETAYELGGIESLIYEWDINGVKKRGYEIDYCFPGAGEYNISVDIIDTIIKKTYANQASYVLELVNEEQPYITSPDSIQVGEEFTLDPTMTFLPGVEIDAYYWFISDGSLYKDRIAKHVFAEEGQYQIKLGVTGTKNGQPFKDCSYKYIISTKEQVKNLVQTVIKPIGDFERDGQLIVNNPPAKETDSSAVVHSIEIASSPTKLKDSDELLAPAASNYIVRALFDPSDSSYIYTVGEWLNIEDAHSTWRDIVDLGYEDASIFSQEKEGLSGLPVNQSFSFKNIQFETDKWDINEDAVKSLEILVLLLKEFDYVKLRVDAHTDDIGREEDNLLLSENRADAILNYLIKEGIEKDRIQGKGYGESLPKFTNETKEGRSKNRRVEFKLIATEKVETIQN